jgi:hypothetical protein
MKSRSPGGQFLPEYTEEDMEVFMDMIAQGTTQEAFLGEVKKMYPEKSMWAILKWYTKARKKLLEESHVV